MSVFDNILSAILGSTVRSQAAAATSGAGAAAASGAAVGQMGGRPQPQPQTGSASAAQAVDVEAVLTEKASKKGEKLNWRQSIVDLMKLLDLDSSLASRKELAQELGYKGELNGSAEMNVWLHKHVMQKLAANGGKVPADLAD
jgi:hypothetical protein